MFRKFIAGFFSAFFVITFLPIVFLWGIFDTFFDQDFYDEDFAAVAYELIAEQFPNLPQFKEIDILSADDLKEVFRNTVTKDDLEIVIKDVVEQLSDIPVDNMGNVKLVIPLRWLNGKSSFFAQSMGEMIYLRLPKCLDSFDVQMINSVFELECLPKEIAKIDFISMVKSDFDQNVFADIPNEFVFDFRLPSNFGNTFFRSLINVVKTIFVFSFILLFAQLCLIAFVIFRPWIVILHWIGKTLFFAGLFLLTLLLLLFYLPELMVMIFADGDLVVLKSFFVLFAGVLMKSLFLYALIPLVLGLCFWLITVFCKKNEQGETD